MSILSRRKSVLSILQAAWRFRNSAILFGSPFLALPLPLLIGTTEAACAYVIVVMALYWCTEALPLAVTALLPIILFPLLGVMQSKDVCMQYLKDTNLLFLGGLTVAVAVETWNLHKRIALRVLLWVGVRPALLMLGFMGVTAFLSMWISNTATTAMMVPIVQAVLDQLNSPRDGPDTPAPHSHGAVQHREQTQPSLSLPENGVDASCQKGEHEKTTSVDEELTECRVHCNHDNKTGAVSCQMQLEEPSGEDEEDERERKRQCKGLLLSVCYAASTGGIATLTGTGPNLVLSGQVNQLFPENGDVINFASWFIFAFPTMLLMLALAWFWLQFLYIGCNLRRTWGCGAAPTDKERAAYAVIREEHQRLGHMSYGEVNVLALFVLLVVLWFTREPRFMDGWATHLFNAKAEYVTDATAAMFVAVLLFVLPAEPPRFLWTDAPVRPSPALLSWQVAQQKMPWNIILLLGGGFALAKGSEDSGLSLWLGSQMSPLHTLPHWAVSILLCLLVAVATECTSNVATATLFLPILASMSQAIGIHPLYVMVPCTLSASFAFMLPVATPPNAIVFSSGLLRVSDMARAGLVMNLIGVLCVSLSINTWGRILFDLDTFPTWANASSIL